MANSKVISTVRPGTVVKNRVPKQEEFLALASKQKLVLEVHGASDSDEFAGHELMADTYIIASVPTIQQTGVVVFQYAFSKSEFNSLSEFLNSEEVDLYVWDICMVVLLKEHLGFEGQSRVINRELAALVREANAGETPTLKGDWQWVQWIDAAPIAEAWYRKWEKGYQSDDLDVKYDKCAVYALTLLSDRIPVKIGKMGWTIRRDDMVGPRIRKFHSNNTVKIYSN